MYNSNVEPIVQAVLEEYPFTRDSDPKLCGMVLWKLGFNVNEKTAKDLFLLWHENKLPSLASMERSRRRLQKRHPRLRGELYDKRQSSQKKVKKRLGYPTATAS